MPNDPDRDPQDSLQKDVQRQEPTQTDGGTDMTVQESPGFDSPTIAAILYRSRASLSRLHNNIRKFPVHGVNLDMLEMARVHARENLGIATFLLTQRESTYTTSTKWTKALHPEFKVPGDVKPESIEDELTHEEPRIRSAPDSSASKLRQDIASRHNKAAPQKLDSNINLDMMDDLTLQVGDMYTYIHGLYKRVHMHVAAHEDIINTKESLQQTFQSLKIVYHILINARDDYAGPRIAPWPGSDTKFTLKPGKETELDMVIIPTLGDADYLPGCEPD